jgi:hypothetical protein
VLKKINLLPLLVILAIAVIQSPVEAVPQKAEQIDTTIIISIDLTGDKKDDSIFCHLTAESWKKPFTVEYKIVCNGEVILTQTSSDEAIDQDFGQPSMMDWCEGYVPCKKDWYLKKLPKEAIKVFKPGGDWRKDFFDTTSDVSLASALKKLYIDSLGFSQEKVTIELKKLESLFKKKNMVYLRIPSQPVYKSFPRFYDPLHKIIVQLYGF